MSDHYQLLTIEQRRAMVQSGILRLEAERFEAELNAQMSDEGEDVLLTDHETAGQRIIHLDRKLERLYAIHEDLT